MTHRIVKQPNGNYAVWSTVVDDFIFIDGDAEEVTGFIVDALVQQAKTQAAAMLKAADEDRGDYSVKPRAGDGLQRWRECLDVLRSMDGDERIARYEEALRTGDWSFFEQEDAADE